MYLSIVQPDFSKVNAARAMTNEQDMHRNIQALFDSDRKSINVLYRFIPSKDIRGAVICVQSDIMPTSTSDLKVLSCTDASERISHIKTGMFLKYDVLLRPVKRHEGRSTLIRDAMSRVEWVGTLAEKYGFEIATIREVSRIQKTVFHSGEKSGRVDGYRYEGSLLVKDADLFKKAYETGIGRDKAYGYGMLMLEFKDA